MAVALTDADLLARLIAFDTTSRNSNLPLVDFVCDYLARPGVEIVRNPNDDHTRVNLVIRVGAQKDDSDSRAGLILSGHTDVVPATEPEWKTDPFVLAESDDAYIGRGTADMKGFVALAVNAARRARVTELRHPLVLLLTFDEELGTRGAQHFVNTWDHSFELPRAVIVGEPTSLRAVNMHKGHLTMRLTTSGRSAHSGYPHLGVNAIEPAARAVTALAELRQQLAAQRPPNSEHFPETPFVALNVARITGGTADNIIPDQCVVDFSARLLPGMDSAPLVESIRATLEDLEWPEPYVFEVVNESPPLLTDPECQIYQAVCSLVSQAEPVGVSYASDAGPLQAMDMDCVLFGPGTIDVAHRPNESVPKSEFAEAGDLIDNLVGRFCRC